MPSNFMGTDTRRRDIAAAVLFFLLAACVQLFFGSRAAEFHLIYPLDDTYIHMAIAKHFAVHGVWGVTPYGFTSSTSSPLYDLLIAGVYRVTGPEEWAPVLLCAIFSVASIVVLGLILEGRFRLPALFALIVAVPLSTMTALGMEHTLHIALALAFLWLGASAIEQRRGNAWLFVVAALLPVARYEGLFLVLSVSVLLALRRCYRLAALIMLSGLSLVSAYGLVSLYHGWHFFPNPIIVKSLLNRTTGVAFLDAMRKVRSTPSLLCLLCSLMLALCSRRLPVWSRASVLTILTLMAMIAHIATADVGWLFRYESYLIALSILALACILPLLEIRVESGTAAVLVFTATAFLGRFLLSSIQTGQMTAAIYHQQYQIGRFLAAYPGAGVAANDIGVMNYFNDLHTIDLVGLADRDVFSAKRRGTFTSSRMEAITDKDGAELAIVYDRWFDGTYPNSVLSGPSIPITWKLVARLDSPGARPLGEKQVSFYAIGPTDPELLREHLRNFANGIPAGTNLQMKRSLD